MSVTVANVRTQISDLAQMWPPQTQPPELMGIGDGATTSFAMRFPNYIAGTLTVFTAPSSGAGGTPPTWTATSASNYSVGAPVATTANSAVTATGSQTVTPASMENIVVGSSLVYDTGPEQETVTVSGITATTFTAPFTLTHASGVAITGAGATQSTQATNAFVAFNAAPTTGTLVGYRAQVTAFSDADLAGYLARAVAMNYPDDATTLKRVQFDIIDILQMDRERLLLLSEGDYRGDPAAYAESLRQLKAELRLDLMGGPQPGTNIPALGIGFSRVSKQYQPYK